MLCSLTPVPSNLTDTPGTLHRSGSKRSGTRLSASSPKHEACSIAAYVTQPCALVQAVSMSHTLQEVASLATLQKVAETRYMPEQLKLPLLWQRVS